MTREGFSLLARHVVASPEFRFEVRHSRECFVGERQVHRLVAVGGEVRRRVGLHHRTCAFRRHHRRGVADAGLEEVDRLRAHAAGVHIADLLARHGRHRELLAALHRVEPMVARGVIEDQSAIGAGDLHPGGAVVRIARRQVPAAADHHHGAIVHRDRAEHDVVRAVDRLHETERALRIDAHGLRGLQQPEHEVEIVRRFHYDWGEPHALADLGAERAGDMTAHQHGDNLAERAVGDFLLGESDLRIEPLRIADGELQVVALGRHDQLVGFPQLERDRLFQQHVLSGAQAVARDREVVRFRRGRDVDDRDVLVLDDVPIVERGGRGFGQRLHLGEAFGPDFADVQLVHQRGARQRLRTDASAPAGADHCRFNLLHDVSFNCSVVFWIF